MDEGRFSDLDPLLEEEAEEDLDDIDDDLDQLEVSEIEEEEDEDEEEDEEDEEEDEEEHKDEEEVEEDEDEEQNFSETDEVHGLPETPRNYHQQPNPSSVSRFVFEATTKAFQIYVNLCDTNKMKPPISVAQDMEWHENGKPHHRVIQQMIVARGFVPFEGADEKTKTAYLPPPTVAVIKEMLKTQKDTIIAFNSIGKLLLIVQIKTGKLGVQQARQIEKMCKKLPLVQLCVVTRQGITPVAKTLLSAMVKNSQFFLTKELHRNYSMHLLVPKQSLLTPQELELLLKKYKITRSQLPQMLRSDPIAKFYGWPCGSVIRSVRIIGQALEPYIYYRCIK